MDFMIDCKQETFVAQQRRFLAYAAPLCMLVVSPFGLSFVTIMFAGWHNKEFLAGVALGNTTYNIFMMSCMCGFCSLLSTYGPAVYGNPKTSRQLGTVLQKVFIISLTVFLIILLPYLNSLKMLRWVIMRFSNQLSDSNLITVNSTFETFSNIQDTAEDFIRGTWSWGLLDFTTRLLSKYLSLQYCSTPVYCCTGLLMMLHVLLTWLFTAKLGLGLHGLILAGTISRSVSLAALLFYCWWKRDILAWDGLTTKVLRNWKEMVILGISATVNVFCENGMYELAIFLSQFRGVNYLTSVVISIQIITLIYSTTYGLTYAASAMIGTALGEGDCSNVKRYIKLSVGNTVVESVVLVCVAYYFRFNLVGLFTSDPVVVEETTSMLWILLIEVPLDHIQTVFTYGILTTVGAQVFVATVLAIVCYGICSPAIVLFIFATDLGGIGVLYGFLLFVTLSCVICGAKIRSLDLETEVKKAGARAEASIS